MNQKVRMLALDLDGTTLTSCNTLSQKTKHAIQKAIAGGIEIVAASGRPYGSIPESILEIEGINYIISSNGAAIHSADGKCLCRKLIKESDVIKFLEITAEYDLIFEAFVDGLTYTDKRYINNPLKYGCGEAYIEYVLSSHGHIENMREFIYKHRTELDSIEIICTDEILRKTMWQKIADIIDGLFITSSSENFIEFMAADATKSNAVEWLCRRLGINSSHTCACGNADNDADMIKSAGLGAAVKNASSLCLKYADLVVASNDNDGIAELIDIIL